MLHYVPRKGQKWVVQASRRVGRFRETTTYSLMEIMLLAAWMDGWMVGLLSLSLYEDRSRADETFGCEGSALPLITPLSSFLTAQTKKQCLPV